MPEKLLQNIVKKVYKDKRRLAAPLVGFPGLKLTGSTIKLAQQNYKEHFNVVNANVQNFKPDAVFPLMDLSVEANALGRYTVFPKEESATVVKDEFSIADLNNLERIDITSDTRLIGYIETIKLMNKNLPSEILKGAYVTGPYTLAALIMGADEAALGTIMQPDVLDELCKVAERKIQIYVRLLIEAGAQMICVLEPSAVMLGADEFEKFSAKYVTKIAKTCESAGVSSIYHICGNTMHLVEKMAASGVDALSLDSPEAGVDLVEVANKIPNNVVIIGNISPIESILKGSKTDVESDVKKILKDMEIYPNFILSTGCDLPQEVPIENIKTFMETARNYKVN